MLPLWIVVRRPHIAPSTTRINPSTCVSRGDGPSFSNRIYHSKCNEYVCVSISHILNRLCAHFESPIILKTTANTQTPFAGNIAESSSLHLDSSLDETNKLMRITKNKNHRPPHLVAWLSGFLFLVPLHIKLIVVVVHFSTCRVGFGVILLLPTINDMR